MDDIDGQGHGERDVDPILRHLYVWSSSGPVIIPGNCCLTRPGCFPGQSVPERLDSRGGRLRREWQPWIGGEPDKTNAKGRFDRCLICNSPGHVCEKTDVLMLDALRQERSLQTPHASRPFASTRVQNSRHGGSEGREGLSERHTGTHCPAAEQGSCQVNHCKHGSGSSCANFDLLHYLVNVDSSTKTSDFRRAEKSSRTAGKRSLRDPLRNGEWVPDNSPSLHDAPSSKSRQVSTW